MSLASLILFTFASLTKKGHCSKLASSLVLKYKLRSSKVFPLKYNGLTELLAFMDIGQCKVQAGLHNANGAGGQDGSFKI